ncbi:hypothetical protein [Streptomyces sp. NPDC047315]|uniref:hypothetical protein n=1 Tax=Streptomyces sp. NPDC047315 TaxID=3155142 RepID=UPI0033EB94BA
MATNTTKKTSTPAAEEPTDSGPVTFPAPAERSAAQPVGPALRPHIAPVTVRLAHHLTIDGTNYAPGTELLVSQDYADSLRIQGYTT